MQTPFDDVSQHDEHDEHDEHAEDDAIPSVMEGDDQPLGVDDDDDPPERGAQAMPGIPTDGEPPSSG